VVGGLVSRETDTTAASDGRKSRAISVLGDTELGHSIVTMHTNRQCIYEERHRRNARDAATCSQQADCSDTALDRETE